MHTGLEPPRGVWWKPAHRSEKVWVAIAFAWCMVLFAMMPLWHWKGGQNPSGTRSRVDPDDFRVRTREFIEQYQVGTDRGMPIVEPPPGSDIYLQARMWAWEPILRLRTDTEYTLHLSSLDLNHGFALYPLNINFQVVPGYDYALRITAREAGDFRIICNEYCGAGHHLMLGRIIVEDGTEVARAGGVAFELDDPAAATYELDDPAAATYEPADPAAAAYELERPGAALSAPAPAQEGGDR